MILISMKRLACAATVLAWGTTALSAAEVPHQENAIGYVTYQQDPTPENPVGVQAFVATGQGTHLGRYTQEGSHTFYLNGTLIGRFDTIASDGATIKGRYFGTFTPIGGGLIEFDVTAIWIEGTGRLEGVTGSGNVIAILDTATGIVTYNTDATWELP